MTLLFCKMPIHLHDLESANCVRISNQREYGGRTPEGWYVISKKGRLTTNVYEPIAPLGLKRIPYAR